MAIPEGELKAPSAPHGVTSTTKSYNDWPNDGGVSKAVANLPFLTLG